MKKDVEIGLLSGKIHIVDSYFLLLIFSLLLAVSFLSAQVVWGPDVRLTYMQGGAPQSEDDVIFGSSGIMFDVFPRPADGVVGIRYGLSGMSLVWVEVYDVMGRRVRHLVDKEVSAGRYQLTWDGCNDQRKKVSAGVYFVQLDFGKEIITEKAVVIR